MNLSNTASGTPSASTFFNQSDLAVLVGLFGTALLLYFLGWPFRRAYRKSAVPPLWFTPHHLTPFATAWPLQLLAGCFYTAVLMLLSGGLVLGWAYMSSSTALSQDLHSIADVAFEFPGVFFIFITGALSVTSVLNTICLLHQKVFEIRSFRDIADIVQMYMSEDPNSRSRESEEDTYFIDYVPVVGALSDPNAYGRIYRGLSKWHQRQHSVTHFIFLAPKAYSSHELYYEGTIPKGQVGPMERVVDEMVSRSAEMEDAKKRKYRQMIKDSADIYGAWDMDWGAVWFAEKVNFEHYIVDVDTAMSYYVIPNEGREETNQVSGSMQSDVKYVSYLRNLCRTYLRQAVTPSHVSLIEHGNNGKKSYTCKIEFRVGQRNISQIEIFLYDLEKRRLPGQAGIAHLPVDQDLHPGTYEVLCSKRPEWIQVKLVKAGSTQQAAPIKSPESFFVRIESPKEKVPAAKPHEAPQKVHVSAAHDSQGHGTPAA